MIARVEVCVGCGRPESLGLVNKEPMCFDCFASAHSHLFRADPEIAASSRTQPVMPPYNEDEERAKWDALFLTGDRPGFYCLHQRLSMEAEGTIEHP